MSVFDEMMNSASNHMKASKVMLIDIDSIKPNKLNTMPITNIEDLVEVLKVDGQIVPLTVYKESNNNYILIAGERRLTALRETGAEVVSCVIIDKPTSEVEERLAIENANAQREESVEIIQLRVKNYSEIFDLIKEKGEIEKGTLKRDWIGTRMNMSGRQVQRYLTADTEKNGDQSEKKVKELEIDKLVKKLKSVLKSVEKLEYEDIEIAEYPSLVEFTNTCDDITTSLEEKISIAKEFKKHFK